MGLSKPLKSLDPVSPVLRKLLLKYLDNQKQHIDVSKQKLQFTRLLRDMGVTSVSWTEFLFFLTYQKIDHAYLSNAIKTYYENVPF